MYNFLGQSRNVDRERMESAAIKLNKLYEEYIKIGGTRENFADICINKTCRYNCWEEKLFPWFRDSDID
jgi:hypothetical protein